MSLPREIKKLIERFRENRDVYCSGAYNETQARREFIDPFFKTLGWDVANEKGYAEAYKDVIHEDAIKVGGATKAPDYAFRIGGMRKFFVEAKRPGVNLKEDGDAAYQLRRYAWSAKLPLSVLTDFEEFAVYDCRIKPAKTDKASTGRVLYLTVDQYEEQWDEIASIFSLDSILTGSFDRYAESTKRKKGTAEVDTAFLKEIEDWRDVLARNIAIRNTALSNREVNFAVQRTIDRIIFLRICEDRGIETYGQLMALQNGTQIYKRLCQIFRRADERYNSGLFHFQKEKDRPEPPDGLTLHLAIDDKALKGILKELYYPESPYEFSVLPADILGQVYEQFLGKVIRLTAGHRAVVEDKPEVKKAGGVYYTPTYIVDYIVEHTVGKLLDGKTPNQVAKLRVLDPACGSGSFLLGAYQTLLDWHLKWYSEHDAEKHAKGRNPKIFRGPGGDWRLTTTEKKRILLNTIYGVDIDPQAVEVTKLSLLLKVLEGENEETIGQSLRLFHERALPDLADNIKCGNSLIGPDFYEGKQLSLIDEEERYRINAFDWNAEFTEIMNGGGFDAVIGNPPWVFTRDVSFNEMTKKYFARHYVGAKGKVNLYALFIHRGTALLNREGWFSMILPNTFLRATSYRPLREHIICERGLEEVTVTGSRVFKGVTASTIIVFVRSDRPTSKVKVMNLDSSGTETQISTIARRHLLTNPGLVVDIYANESARNLIDRIRTQCQPLSVYTRHLISGIQTWKQHKSRFISNSPLNPQYKPLLEGKDINRYELKFAQKYILYSKKILNVMQDERIFLLPEKILIQRVSGGNQPLKATLDRKRFYCFNSINTLVCYNVDNRFVLGILNSRFMNWFYSVTFTNRSELTVNIATRNLKALPIPPIDLSDPADVTSHDHMAELVEQMLSLRQQLTAAKTDHEKSLLQRQIQETDKQIDQLVYELYGLTGEEIRIVEETTQDA